MRLLAISGSLRAASANTALLQALARIAEAPVSVTLWAGLGDLPIFSPDLEASPPAAVLSFVRAVGQADGVVIACPEYARAMPGGFKNALDWLVSRDEIIGKPVALLHGSHRGEDVLADLHRVLSTIADGFQPDLFARFHLMKMSPEDIAGFMEDEPQAAALRSFLDTFCQRIAGRGRVRRS
jgi:NAD(P)H-dependent FMN reductase